MTLISTLTTARARARLLPHTDPDVGLGCGSGMRREHHGACWPEDAM